MQYLIAYYDNYLGYFLHNNEYYREFYDGTLIQLGKDRDDPWLHLNRGCMGTFIEDSYNILWSRIWEERL